MKKQLIKYLFLAIVFCSLSEITFAQAKKRSAVKRNTTRKTTRTKTKASITPTVATTDTLVAVAAAAVNDSLPIKAIKKSLRPDEAVETTVLRERIPLPYEHLRADDAVYRHKVWREIDTREKINLPFRYSADENNGNQRFIPF